MGIQVQRLIQMLGKRAYGLDALSVIPAVSLDDALQDTLKHINGGLIPQSYQWTPEKTKYAYSYKNYGSWVKSIIVAAKYYYTDEEWPDEGRTYGRFARYTWRNNYSYLRIKLKELVQGMEEYLGREIRSIILSNYTSLPEKILFRHSKLADIGKNGTLISGNMGSYFVIGEALTDLEVEFTAPESLKPPDFAICGDCSECIKACPTGAIVENGVVDINRCFQYMSENLLLIPREYREKWSDRLYGCSTCLDVCPFNFRLKPWGEKHSIGYVGPGMDLISVLTLSEKEWHATFRNNQILIRDRLAIVKNAMLALGNIGYGGPPDILPPYLNHPDPIIRAYSAWTLGKIKTREGNEALRKQLKRERDQAVLSEIRFFVNGK